LPLVRADGLEPLASLADYQGADRLMKRPRGVAFSGSSSLRSTSARPWQIFIYIRNARDAKEELQRRGYDLAGDLKAERD